MFRRVNGKLYGVVNDWDYAVMEHTDEKPPPASMKKRTGTPPFMAIDLLRAPDSLCIHYYRHDLESFFWILLWCMLHMDLAGNLLPTKEGFSGWVDANMEEVAMNKYNFLRTDIVFTTIYKTAIQEAFKPLLPVLVTLHQMFLQAHEELAPVEEALAKLDTFKIPKAPTEERIDEDVEGEDEDVADEDSERDDEGAGKEKKEVKAKNDRRVQDAATVDGRVTYDKFKDALALFTSTRPSRTGTLKGEQFCVNLSLSLTHDVVAAALA